MQWIWALFRLRPTPQPQLPIANHRLSKNFTLAEMTRSRTARVRGIDNTPDAEAVRNLTQLCERVLQRARNALGALTVTSGYRSLQLNKAVKGARDSDHTKGMAADIVPTGGVTLEQLGKWIQDNCEFKQLIYEFGEWLHVSYDPDDIRGQVLEAYKDSHGKTRYRIYRFK